MGALVSLPLVWYFVGFIPAVVYTAVVWVSPWTWVAPLTVFVTAPNAPSWVLWAAGVSSALGIARQLGVLKRVNLGTIRL